MKTITIEWMHLDINGATCDRCADTGTQLVNIITKLNKECLPKQVQFAFKETILSESEIEKSNLIQIDGIPIEEILPQTSASKSSCCSCGELTGKDELCRTIIHFDKVYEAVPETLIRDAICRVAGCC